MTVSERSLVNPPWPRDYPGWPYCQDMVVVGYPVHGVWRGGSIPSAPPWYGSGLSLHCISHCITTRGTSQNWLFGVSRSGQKTDTFLTFLTPKRGRHSGTPKSLTKPGISWKTGNFSEFSAILDISMGFLRHFSTLFSVLTPPGPLWHHRTGKLTGRTETLNQSPWKKSKMSEISWK